MSSSLFCLVVLLRSERTLYKLAKAGVVRALVQLAQADDVRVRQHAVRGLANFAQSGTYLSCAGRFMLLCVTLLCWNYCFFGLHHV